MGRRGRPRRVVERHHVPDRDRLAQQCEQAIVQARPRPRAHRQPLGFGQRLHVGLDPAPRLGFQHGAQLVAEPAEHGGALVQTGAVERVSGGGELRQLLRRERDQVAQRPRPQPAVAPGLARGHRLQGAEHVLHGVAEAFGGAAADLELALDVVQGQAAPAPLQPDRQPHDVRRPVVRQSAVSFVALRRSSS